MRNFPSKLLTTDEISALERDCIEEAQAGRTEAAWQALQPLRSAQHRQRDAAWLLVRIVHQRRLPMERAADILSEIVQSHHQEVDIVAALGECLEAARDIDDLNAPPPVNPVFKTVVERLVAFAKIYEGL